MEDVGTILAMMRATAPLVHQITNYVAMNIAANVDLAAGSSPAMVHARDEVGHGCWIPSAWGPPGFAGMPARG